MAVISKLNLNGEDITKYKDATISEINIINATENLPAGTYHFANANESIGTCENAVNEPIIDMQLSGNSVQNGTPTPEISIEIESVGKKTKNLCGGNNVLLKTLIGNADTGVLITSSNYNTVYMEVNEGEVYSFTGFESASGVRLRGVFYDSGKNYISLFSGETVTVPTGAKYMARSYLVSTSEVQVELGSKVTDYEPYGYKIPVNIQTKNLFNADEWTNGTKTTFNNVDCLLIKDYSFYSYTIDGDSSTRYMFSFRIYRNDEDFNKKTNLTTTSGRSIAANITHGEGRSVIVYGGEKLYFTGYSADMYIDLSVTQLEVGTTATEYEPYINETTNIYLNEPLRKIGDYADYIDYKNKKVVRNIGQITLNGSEDWKMATKYFYLASEGISDIVYSNHFKGIMPTTSDNMNNYEIQITASGNWFIRYDEFNGNLSGFKEWLFTNNITNQYILKTLTEETIDIPEMSTFKGTNVFDTETNIKASEIKINYWKQI